MSEKVVLVEKQTDLWKWVGTRKFSFSCSRKLADEYIQEYKQDLFEKGEEVLDVYMYTYAPSLLDIVAVKMLVRPKRDGKIIAKIFPRNGF